MSYPTGPQHHKAKITTEMVKLIRKFHQQGMTYAQCAEIAQCSLWTARDIVTYATRISE